MNNIVECLKKLGYNKLTALQQRVFNIVVKENRSVIVVAPTGSGKTEAALFPIMYLIKRLGLKPISAIYVTPLRALNRDIEDRIKGLAKCFDLKVSLRHGDTPYSARKAVEKDPPHILVTTPETLNYLFVNKRIKVFLENTTFLVIDEFRDLYESKRGALLFLTTYLMEQYLLKKRLLKIALTATLCDEVNALKIVEGSYSPSSTMVVRDDSIKKMMVDIVVSAPGDGEEGVLINDIVSDRELSMRLRYILDVLRRNNATLIFTNTRSLAERLGYLLNTVIDELGFRDLKIGVHHGSLSKTHRISVENDFKKGVLNGLIATSSMELGIDIGRIDYVIQYMSPRQATRLVQRIGRSGHVLGGVSKGSIIVMDNVFQILESIVLTRRALSNELEVENSFQSPLDVLAYAIALTVLVVDNGVDKYDLYNRLINHPLYTDLDYDTYTQLIDYLRYTRVVRVDGNKLLPTRRTRLYVYKTTMIPDTRDIIVIDLSSDKQVGVLNEEYVVLNINEDDHIVLGGRSWRVVGYDPENAKLYVEEMKPSSEAIIPHWEGENIPVEYSVAREIGSLVRRLRNNDDLSQYEAIVGRDLWGRIRDRVADLGDDKTIVIDYCRELDAITINLYGGSRVNRFFNDLLKTLINMYLPFIKIRSYSTPYSIIIKLENRVSEYYVEMIMKHIEDILKGLDKYLDPVVLKNIVVKQNTLYWRIYQVAQRFGAIDPGETRVTKNILEGFVDSVIGMEALKEVLNRDYDLASVRKLYMDIASGRVRVVKRYSEKTGIFHREVIGYIEIPSSIDVKPLDKERYRERLLNRKITLVCIKCGNIVSGRVRDFTGWREYRCPKCGYKTLAPVKSNGELERNIVLKNLKGSKLSSGESRVLEDLRLRALLLLHYGELALLVLSSRGVGVSEARRIISNVIQGGDLYDLLYEGEKRFLRVKRYIERGRKT